MRITSLFVASLLSSLATSQTTWIVDAGGGGGAQFADLPTAVAAAADGDTIIVRTGPFNEGASPFTTDKGLTIVGEGGAVPIGTSYQQPIVIENLPAGSSFRMCGFSRPSDGELNFWVRNCAGSVRLERIAARERQLFGTYNPAIEIFNSQDVTLVEVGTFGYPAVQIDSSRVALVRCQLGKSYILIGDGPCVHANYSTVDITEPRFDTNASYFAAVHTVQTDLRVGGSVSSYITNPGDFAILSSGGSATVDPQVALSANSFLGPTIGVDAWQSVPATFTGPARAGQSVDVSTAANAASFVWTVIGDPGPRLDSPLGVLGIDLNGFYGFLPGTFVPALGPAVESLAIPATMPLGATFTAQALVLDGSGLRLSLPTQMIVH